MSGLLPCPVRQGSPGRVWCCWAWQAMEAPVMEQPHPPHGYGSHGGISALAWADLVFISLPLLCGGFLHTNKGKEREKSSFAGQESTGIYCGGSRAGGERDGLLPVSPSSSGRGSELTLPLDTRAKSGSSLTLWRLPLSGLPLSPAGRVFPSQRSIELSELCKEKCDCNRNHCPAPCHRQLDPAHQACCWHLQACFPGFPGSRRRQHPSPQ